jgi:hypothetical protein
MLIFGATLSRLTRGWCKNLKDELKSVSRSEPTQVRDAQRAESDCDGVVECASIRRSGGYRGWREQNGESRTHDVTPSGGRKEMFRTIE